MPERTFNSKPIRPGGGKTRRRGVIGKITSTKPTAVDVEKRARQLAAIGGRNANRPTDSDRRQAKRELMSRIHPTRRRPITRDTQQWDPAPASTGRKAPTRGPRDDQVTKNLVEEGVDEAEHSQMLSAHKTRTRNTG